MWEYNYIDTLAHHGIKGQKWGVRRYRNEDGTLTDAGRKRYLNADGSFVKLGQGKISTKDAAKEMEAVREEEQARLQAVYKLREKSDEMKDLRAKHAKVTGMEWSERDNCHYEVLEWDDPKNERRYNKLSKDMELWAETSVAAGKKATDYILQSYGKEKLDAIERRTKRTTTAAVGVGVAASILILPFVPVIYAASAAHVKKKLKKAEESSEENRDGK